MGEDSLAKVQCREISAHFNFHWYMNKSRLKVLGGSRQCGIDSRCEKRKESKVENFSSLQIRIELCLMTPCRVVKHTKVMKVMNWWASCVFINSGKISVEKIIISLSGRLFFFTTFPSNITGSKKSAVRGRMLI